MSTNHSQKFPTIRHGAPNTKLTDSSKPVRLHGRSGKPHLSRPCKGNHSIKRVEAFDPADLCRRLESIVQEELQSKSYLRQQAAKHSYSATYHHVPQVAAKDFAATTAQDAWKKRDVHKLSRSVVMSYKLGNNMMASERNGIRSFDYRDFSTPGTRILADRTQFQRSRTFETAALRDQARAIANIGAICDTKQPSVGLYQGVHAWSLGKTEESDKANIEDNSSKLEVKSLFNRNDRHDWTQRDESSNSQRRGFRFLIAPLMYRPSKRRNEATKLLYRVEENSTQISL